MERLSGCAPEHICQLLKKGCTGHVEMVNSRGIYLQLAGKRILLCHSGFGTVPNGVALDQWEQLPALLATGQPVQVEKDRLSLPSGSWQLELSSVPRDTRVLTPDKNWLDAGIQVLLANTKPTGLSSLAYPLFARMSPKMNLYCDMALPHVRALLQALREENLDGIRCSVSGLLGLGPGLTPSGDDLLSGLLYGLRHSPVRDGFACTVLSDTIREMAPERTNAVSADYLIALADDAPFDCMAAAWEIPAGAARLLQIGSNSGGEMLLGLLCAAQLWLAK